MKIIVLHGDHTRKSFERLGQFRREAKKRGWRLKTIDKNEKLSLSENLSTRSMFDKKTLFIINDLNSLKKNEFEWLKKNTNNIEETLVFYHGKPLRKTIINSLPKPNKVEEFMLPKKIWQFLDSFYPGNVRACLKLFYQVLESEPVEFVFALLNRHLRDLYCSMLDDVELSIPSWRVEKLQKQAGKLGKNLIKKIISQLAEADVKSKTSQATLADLLDFIIVTKLE